MKHQPGNVRKMRWRFNKYFLCPQARYTIPHFQTFYSCLQRVLSHQNLLYLPDGLPFFLVSVLLLLFLCGFVFYLFFYIIYKCGWPAPALTFSAPIIIAYHSSPQPCSLSLCIHSHFFFIFLTYYTLEPSHLHILGRIGRGVYHNDTKKGGKLYHVMFKKNGFLFSFPFSMAGGREE